MDCNKNTLVNIFENEKTIEENQIQLR